jgi:hypothetical protein
LILTSCTSPPLSATAASIKKKPTPRMIIPSPILTGVVSFFPVFDTQNIPKSGAKSTMNNGFTDWNQAVGIS